MSGQRLSRSFSIARRQTASTSAGMSSSGRRLRSGTTGSSMCLVRMPMKVSAVNGTAPVSMWYMMQPMA